tara:strand:- start:1114 stop:1545 length:432 start_codon:yes stop_codon:yes gene_type:complete
MMGLSDCFLETLMGRNKTERTIKFCCVLPRFIRCQLDYPTPAFSARINSPTDHFLTQTGTASFGGYANTFNLAAPCPLSGQSGNEAKLKTANDDTLSLKDDKNLIGIIIDGLKGGQVIGMQGRGGILTAPTKNIISKQANDGW